MDKIVFLFNFYQLKQIIAYLTIPKLLIETENYGILGSFYQEINSFSTKYTKNFVNHTNKNILQVYFNFALNLRTLWRKIILVPIAKSILFLKVTFLQLGSKSRNEEKVKKKINKSSVSIFDGKLKQNYLQKSRNVIV